MKVTLKKAAEINGNKFPKGWELDVHPDFGHELIKNKIAILNDNGINREE